MGIFGKNNDDILAEVEKKRRSKAAKPIPMADPEPEGPDEEAPPEIPETPPRVYKDRRGNYITKEEHAEVYKVHKQGKMDGLRGGKVAVSVPRIPVKKEPATPTTFEISFEEEDVNVISGIADNYDENVQQYIVRIITERVQEEQQL